MRKKKKRNAGKAATANRRDRNNRRHPVVLPSGYSTPQIKAAASFDHPFAGLTHEQKCAAFEEITQSADERFKAAELALRGKMRDVDPVELLTTVAHYCLQKPVGPDTDFTDDGPYPQAVIELVQAVLLAQPREAMGQRPVFNGDIHESLEAAKSCMESLGLRFYSDAIGSTPEETSIRSMVLDARTQTSGVRNWAYPQHLRQIVCGLFEPLEPHFKELVGCTVKDLFDFFDHIGDTTGDRLLDFYDFVRETSRGRDERAMISAWGQEFGWSDEAVAEVLDVVTRQSKSGREKKAVAFQFLHHLLRGIYCFSSDDLIACGMTREVLDLLLPTLSYSIGELHDISLETLLLDNPIRLRPFIQLADDQYCIPIVGLFNSFALKIVESLIRTDASFWDRYLRRRASYLEDAVAGMLSGVFQGRAQVFRNVKWVDPDSGCQYETDCLILAPPFAIVVEAKSSQVTDPARRGAEERLRREFRRLVDDPAMQANRLARLITNCQTSVRLVTAGNVTLSINPGMIRRAVPLTVSLDCLPVQGLSWQNLVRSGMVGPDTGAAIAMSLADLLVAVTVLDSPAVLLHYLLRRIEFEEAITYLGDEDDVLVFYLSNGLAPPHLSDGARPLMVLHGNSVELRRYFCGVLTSEHADTPKPRRMLTGWWARLIDRVTTLDRERKWEMTSCLLDVPFDDQRRMELDFRGLVKYVARFGNKRRREAIVGRCPNTESNGAVILFAYKDLSDNERRRRAASLASQTQDQHQVNRVVVIGHDVRQFADGRPYDTLYFFDYTSQNSS